MASEQTRHYNYKRSRPSFSLGCVAGDEEVEEGVGFNLKTLA